MSSEKQTYNGRVKYYGNGYVGIKDYDGKIIIPTSLRYTDIFEYETVAAIIVCRDGKWALADLNGEPLCPFIYNRIVYIGEHYFKAGIRVKPNDGRSIVEYADTRMTYAILDNKGEVVCPGDLGYNYISEIHDGEVTAAINGKCGIIDIHGGVVMDFKYKYIQHMGEGHYLVSYEYSDNYYATIINRDNQILIPASMEYRSIGNFHNGVARAFQKGKWGLIDENGRHISNFEYTFIEECGEGYYRAEKGSKKNIMRPDGSLVLNDWVNDAYDISNGLFIFSNTIRKSRTNPKTRYIHGLAHVNGDILFPMIFDRLSWLEDKWALYAELGTKPYFLTLYGGVYDPQGSHLPKKLKIDEKSFFESLANWVLPGLQFFYRDTNAPIDAADLYHVGDTIRAGFYVDATTKLSRPAHRTRFLIASAHAARLYEVESLTKENPDIVKWNQAVFHYNSYFKVMDVYETELCTQVFLLHIPMSAAKFLKWSIAFQFLNEASGNISLVSMARESLDQKLQMEFHERSFDEKWCNRMEQPIGMSVRLEFFPLDAEPEPEDEQAAAFSKFIHLLAEDADIEFKTEVDDNFPWEGIEGRVCDGCIFADTIIGKGEACGKLTKDEFRENYIKGSCLHYKTPEDKESEFERRERKQAEEAKEKEEKTSNVYALRLIKEFISEKLDGDIDKLREYNLSSLRDDSKYGGMDIPRFNIVKAIMSVVFSDVWPGLNVENLENYTYWCDTMNRSFKLLGSNILGEYFKGLEKFYPTAEQTQRAMYVEQLEYSIGNIWVLPNKDTFDVLRSGPKYRDYMDKFLQGLYNVLTGQEGFDRILQGILYKNRKLMVDYQGEEGFRKLVKNLMLEDYVDSESKPKELFMFVWCSKKWLKRDEYFKAFDIFCSFCEKAIPRRAERIIEKLKALI